MWGKVLLNELLRCNLLTKNVKSLELHLSNTRAQMKTDLKVNSYGLKTSIIFISFLYYKPNILRKAIIYDTIK